MNFVSERKSSGIECKLEMTVRVIAGEEFLPLFDEERLIYYVNEKDFFETLKIVDEKRERKKLKSNLTPGRKPTKEKQFGQVVRNLRNDGMSIRKIAAYVGISTTTVQKILKNTKNTKNGEN